MYDMIILYHLISEISITDIMVASSSLLNNKKQARPTT